MHVGNEDVLVFPALPDAMGQLRRQSQQRADGAAGLRAGAQLQHLAEQNQHGDHRRRFVIDGDATSLPSHTGRKEPGRHRRDDAVGVGNTDTERDQGEHVEVT